MNAQAIIADLMRAGLTQMEIQRRSGVDQSTVSSLYTGKRGKRTSYETIARLKELWSEVCASEFASAGEPQ